MRTTLVIDDDLLEAAKMLAEERSVSIGAVISELARKGLNTGGGASSRNGFPVFDVSDRARVITPEDIRRAEDEA